MRVCRYYNTPPVPSSLVATTTVAATHARALHRTRETIGVYDRSAPREAVNQKS